MNETAKSLADKGYLSAFIANHLNIRYRDYLAMKSNLAELSNSTNDKIINGVKMLLTNCECYLKNQKNLLNSAKGLAYTGTLYKKIRKVSPEIIESYSAWDQDTIKDFLYKLENAKGKNEFELRDNDLLILYNIYSHQGSFNYVQYKEDANINVDNEYEYLRDYFTINSLDTEIARLGYKSRREFARESGISLNRVQRVANGDFNINNSRTKSLLKEVYEFVMNTKNKKKKIKKTYKSFRWNQLSEEEREWYLTFDFNSVIDNRFGFKQASIIKLLNKLGFDEQYYSTWCNLSKHITDYGNYILVKALYNYVHKLDLIDVNIGQEEVQEEESVEEIDKLIESEKEEIKELQVSKMLKDEQEELEKLRELKALREEKEKLKRELGLI